MESIRPTDPASETRFFFVRDKSGFKMITEPEIIYLEASRSYCNIHLRGDKVILVSVPMAKVSEHLSTDKFIRIHRTFIINIPYIVSLIGNTLKLQNGVELTIGREYRQTVFSRFVFIGSKNSKYEAR
ncbi:MAG: LytTR family transcriptional regulator [Alistipes sp.]|nr:LytTR family transcriptional regulator [Alistipes sp.]